MQASNISGPVAFPTWELNSNEIKALLGESRGWQRGAAWDFFLLFFVNPLGVQGLPRHIFSSIVQMQGCVIGIGDQVFPLMDFMVVEVENAHMLDPVVF